MTPVSWNDITEEQLNPLARRKVLHTQGMTIARLWLARGGTVPRHHHINEQVTTMESGRLRFFFDDDNALVLSAGESLVIPPNVPHGVEALDDCVAVDLFTPRREDWITGDDAYLRGGATR
jgi:quercetin dioxygenase-like cupin family protein